MEMVIKPRPFSVSNRTHSQRPNAAGTHLKYHGTFPRLKRFLPRLLLQIGRGYLDISRGFQRFFLPSWKLRSPGTRQGHPLLQRRRCPQGPPCSSPPGLRRLRRLLQQLLLRPLRLHVSCEYVPVKVAEEVNRVVFDGALRKVFRLYC